MFSKKKGRGLKDDRTQSEQKLNQIFVLDTCIFLKELKWVKMLGRALKKGRLDGKVIKGKVVVPDAVWEEIHNMYGGLRRKKKLEKNEKKLFWQARKAQEFLDEEMGPDRRVRNSVFQIEYPRNYSLLKALGADPKILSYPVGQRDLEILATAMEIREKERRNIIFVTWDGGLKKAAARNRFYVKGSLKSFWEFYRLMYRAQIKLGLKKNGRNSKNKHKNQNH